MRKYILIGLGGFFGAIARFGVKGIRLGTYQGNVPLNTLTINILGCFILALILTTAVEVCGMDEAVKLGIATGFLGAFTTFSTLCRELTGLLAARDFLSFFSYLAASVVLGFAAVLLGTAAAREIVPRIPGIAGKSTPEQEPEPDVEGGAE